MNNKIWIVIPCYNEDKVLPETASALAEKMKNLIQLKKISKESKVVFVNDGSTDNTWPLIKQISEQDKLFAGINLSHNKGHQNALLAGLLTVYPHADAVISMDADLQDDIDSLDSFIDEFMKGNDIVFGVRKSRSTDTFFKRTTALAFYNVMKFLGVEIVSNHADYRLMSKRAIDALSNYQEVNLFLRGIIPEMGFKTSIVYYERKKRLAGVSKYPLGKMFGLALDGISSFSIAPLRIATLFSIFSILVSLGMLFYGIIRWEQGYTVSGWTSLSVSIWFLGGLQLLIMGIIGEYVGKMYMETKKRPRYLIETTINIEAHKKD